MNDKETARKSENPSWDGLTLMTPRLLLRPIIPKDAADIFEYARNPNVGIHAGWQPHVTIEETLQIMDEVFLGQPHVFGIVLRETGKLFGTIGLIPDPKRKNSKVLMLGYAVGEEHWGHGYTTEAARAVLRYGFDSLGLDLVSVHCYPHNDRSKRVIAKCGFRHEGTLRQAEIRYDGAILGNDCFSLTSEEFRDTDPE